MARKKHLFGVLSGRRGAPQIAVGHRYKKRDAPWVVWEVTMLTTGTDGNPYVQLVRVGDPTMRKTVSRATLDRGIEYLRFRDF